MTLSVALVGAGNIAKIHLDAIRRARDVEVVGIFDVNSARARERADAYGIPTVYASWDALRADSRVQCIAVLLPHDLHERFAVEGLAAGKHVVCEKPLGQNVAECDRVLAAADRAGRKVFPVHNRLYDWATARIKEILDDGQIGDVARVACLFGDRKVVDMTHEDTAIATLKFTSGIVGEMTATFGIGPGPFDHQIMIHGREGYLQLTTGRALDPITQPFALEAIAPKMFGDNALHRVELEPSHGWDTGFTRMWEDYGGSLADGSATRVTGPDGKRAVEIIEAAYRANATGRVVDLPLMSRRKMRSGQS